MSKLILLLIVSTIILLAISVPLWLLKLLITNIRITLYGWCVRCQLWWHSLARRAYSFIPGAATPFTDTDEAQLTPEAAADDPWASFHESSTSEDQDLSERLSLMGLSSPILFFDVENPPNIEGVSILLEGGETPIFYTLTDHSRCPLLTPPGDLLELARTHTWVGWNPVNDLDALEKVGIVPSRVFRLDLAPFIPGSSTAKAPSLKSVAQYFGVPIPSKHATSEVITMKMILGGYYLKQQ